MRLILLRLVVAAFAVLVTLRPALAEDPAVLLADVISFDGSSVLVAEGHVEVFYEGIRLSARRISYDRTTGSLVIDGPIILDDGKGARLFASQAQLSDDLQAGILYSARMVLDDKLQMAAQSVERFEGRYTRLNQTVASQCRICAGSDLPLWQIRAREVIHDAEAKRIWFKDAELRIGKVPVFWMPRLRLPDPSVERASGFLVPRLRTTTLLGAGLKMPYFQTFGRHADVTLTPYVGAKTRTLQFDYRQSLPFGTLQVLGAASEDSIRPGELRAFLEGHGSFRLPADFRLTFDVTLTSDPGYLLDYGFSNRDRLFNSIEIERIRKDQRLLASFTNVRSLRDSEIPISDMLPGFMSELRWQQRYQTGLGGRLDVDLGLFALNRSSTLNTLGRDVTSLQGDVAWTLSRINQIGIAGDLTFALNTRAALVAQDNTYDTPLRQVVPAVALDLRWPLVASRSGGRQDILEPKLQLAWSDSFGDTLPNEDSTLSEFDEGNLLALSRFPGDDRIETGARAAFGVTWRRELSRGWYVGADVGKIFRGSDNTDFSNASGLNEVESDWLAAFQAEAPDGLLSLNSRFQLDSDLSMTKGSAGIALHRDRFDLAGRFDWVVADLAEDRPDPIAEVSLDGTWRLANNWTAQSGVRFDAGEGDVTEASFGLRYENECIRVDFSLSRRFTSSTSVDPATDVDFQVALGGFGEKNETARRLCAPGG